MCKFLAVKIAAEDESSILRLESVEDLQHFEQQFGVSYLGDCGGVTIDWSKVMHEGGYKGVQIMPYWEDFAMTSDWYSSWDCSCGVLWDKDLIDRSTRQMF